MKTETSVTGVWWLVFSLSTNHQSLSTTFLPLFTAFLRCLVFFTKHYPLSTIHCFSIERSTLKAESGMRKAECGKRNGGFTLVELLVVLIIIGLLGGVALRAIDAVQDRARFDETERRMRDLEYAILGNPEIVSDGKRVDFGFVGDMGRLPNNLEELLNNPGGNWQGPYIRVKFLEDTINPTYRRDAWGNPFIYSPTRQPVVIESQGNGRQRMTLKLTDSLSFLFGNRISGSVVDRDNNPPGEYFDRIQITIFVPENGLIREYSVHPQRSGFYEFNPQNSRIPIGNHRMVLTRTTASPETLEKWVSVLPKSKTIVDFKFSGTFRSNLIYVEGSGMVVPGETSSITFEVMNIASEPVQLTSLTIDSISGDSAFCDSIFTSTGLVWGFGRTPQDTWRIGKRMTAPFDPQFTIPPKSKETFRFWRFMNRRIGPADEVNMRDRLFLISFSDGSRIGPFTTP